MTPLPKELSPERCHQLREGGILRVLINLLHEHTFEPQSKPEADFNMELFIMDLNRKAELRARSSKQLRTIVGHTAKNDGELKILDMLEVLRKYIDRLYNFIVDWKSMKEDPSTLSECTDQLIELAKQMNEAIKELIILTANDTNRSFFEQFGGVFVIVDYLRAQTRFNTKCRQFEPAQIDTSPLLGVANDSKLVLGGAVAILRNLVITIDSNKDIRLFLGNSRSLQEIMVGVAEEAYDGGHLQVVQFYCHFLTCLYDLYTLSLTGVGPSTSHRKDCGVIKCLAKFGMNIKDPKTLHYVLEALESSLVLDRQIALELVSIDGAIDMLIDVLVPSKEKDEDVENAEWYEMQQVYSMCLLSHMSLYLVPQDQMSGRLLAIYEARDIAAILVRDLEQITLIDDSPTTRCVLELLKLILGFSEDQRRKIKEMANGAEVVKRFESSDDRESAEISKQIGKMFE